ncbi:hypothetical protein M011DRAFT_479030 [Sporormia fimetaria CBS 119925]|uniref:SET domain-containing protein n=1 Tax=Sporormia fimetaria CBS 119925 TaxID=1340428 RepID=A0A6A6V660_9PLEO|nr:hypothetical protein M011DRAFT_479030 [Sporormia fimetaria CBS 119925]
MSAAQETENASAEMAAEHILGDYLELLPKQRETFDIAQTRVGERASNNMPRKQAYDQHMYTHMMAQKSVDPTEVGLADTPPIIFLPAPYPPCVTPDSDLSQMYVDDLRIATHHRGKYLLLRVFAPPIRIAGIHLLVEDVHGDYLRLALYLQYPDLVESELEDVFSEGTVLLVKEPCCRLHTDETCGVRVDHVSDVEFIATDDERVPSCWKTEQKDSKTTADTLKQEGNDFVRKGMYWAARKRYTQALRISSDAIETEVIKRNLALTHIETQDFEAALKILGYPTLNSHDSSCDRALLRASQALHPLGRFEESLEVLEKYCLLYPGDDKATHRLKQARMRKIEMTTGDYDFKSMQKLAGRLEPPLMDHADYVGPVEIRESKLHGRGLFITRDVEVGELLLCEKAFCYASGKARPATLFHLEATSVSKGALAEVILRTIHKASRNPSLASRILSLHPGTYKPCEVQTSSVQPVIDSFFIEAVVNHTSYFCRPSLKLYEEEVLKRVKPSAERKDCGFWVLPSYINHSCLGNCQRSFIGDLFILRATRDLPKDTELVTPYVLGSGPGFEAQMRKTWGFTCTCPLCLYTKTLPDEFKSKETKLINSIKCYFPAGGVPASALTSVNKKIIANLLDKLEAIYRRPAKEIPRDNLAELQLAFADDYLLPTDDTRVIDYLRKSLESVGFVFKPGSSPKGFRVVEWGHHEAATVRTFIKLAEFFLVPSTEKRREDVMYFWKECAEMIYKIWVGENETFTRVYTTSTWGRPSKEESERMAQTFHKLLNMKGDDT